MKVVSQIREDVELALDFVDDAVTATLRMPIADGAAMRRRLAAARAALQACYAEAGQLARLQRSGPSRWPRRLRRGLRCLAWRVRGRRHSASGRLDLLYGQRAITRWLGLTRAQGRSILAERRLPTFKLAGVTCARRSSIRQHLLLLERQRKA